MGGWFLQGYVQQDNLREQICREGLAHLRFYGSTPCIIHQAALSKNVSFGVSGLHVEEEWSEPNIRWGAMLFEIINMGKRARSIH